MRRTTLFFAAAVLSLTAAPLGAAIIHVPVDHPTIQEAIDASADGDTVHVPYGSYYENIRFRGSAKFSLDLRGVTDPVEITIHDVAGRVVRVLQIEHGGSGRAAFPRDGRTDSGDRVPCGVYFCRLAAGDVEERATLVALR